MNFPLRPTQVETQMEKGQQLLNTTSSQTIKMAAQATSQTGIKTTSTRFLKKSCVSKPTWKKIATTIPPWTKVKL